MFNKIKSILIEVKSKLQSCISQLIKYDYHDLYKNTKKVIETYSNEIKAKASNLPKTNFDLAIYHFNIGNINDAILRFKLVRFMTKINDATIDYYLGRCYLEKYQYIKAVEYITKYLKSGDQNFIQEAKYCDLILNNKQDYINLIPSSLLQRKRNRYGLELKQKLQTVSKIEKDLNLNSLNDGAAAEYNVLNFILPYIKNKLESNDMLEILPGIGNFGYLCRKEKISHLIVGVEPSDLMAKTAKKLKYDTLNVYSEVMQFSNLLNFFAKAENAHNFKYGIIVAHDILSYYSNITQLLDYISNIITNNGVLVLYFRNANDKKPINQESANPKITFNSNREEFDYDPLFIANKIETTKWFIIHEQAIQFEFDNSNGKVLVLSKNKFEMPKVSLQDFFIEEENQIHS